MKGIVTYVKGEWAGLTIESLIENRADGLWAKPLNREYQKIAYKKALGYVPIGDRGDWSKWGFIAGPLVIEGDKLPSMYFEGDNFLTRQ